MKKLAKKEEEITPKAVISNKKVKSIEELSSQSLDVLSKALKRTDNTGLPDKLAIESAKFVQSNSSVTDNNEYKKMLATFRKVIITSRGKLK